MQYLTQRRRNSSLDLHPLGKGENSLLPLLSAHEQSPQREGYLVAALFSNPALSSDLTGDHPRCRSVISVCRKHSQIQPNLEGRGVRETSKCRGAFRESSCPRQLFVRSFKEP